MVKCDTSANELLSCVRKAAPESLCELKLFDLYEGEGIDSSMKSIALGLTFQEQSRTLTDTEIEAAIESIITALGDQLNACLRD